MVLEPEEEVGIHHLPVTPTEFVRHEPDTWGPIQAIARTQGAAPVASVHMRSFVWQRIERESNYTLDPPALAAEEGFGIVIDDSIPMFPGFEIHREV